MKIIGHSMAAPHLDCFEYVKLLAAIGFDGIDLICDNDYPCAISRDASYGEIEQVKQHADYYGIKIGAITPYIREINVRSATRRKWAIDELRKCIDIAKELDCRSVRILAGLEPEKDEWEDAFNRLVDSLRQLSEYAASANLCLNVENHSGSMAVTAQQTARIISEVDQDNIGILYDPANLIIYGDPNYEDAFKEQASDIRHVHVKDDLIFEGSGYLPVLMGEGVIPWPSIMSLLQGSGYQGFLCLEYEKRWHPDILPDTKVGLRHELKVVRQLLEKGAVL